MTELQIVLFSMGLGVLIGWACFGDLFERMERLGNTILNIKLQNKENVT